MKALFVHDHIFLTDGKKYYSDKLPYNVWNRYLKYFSEISIFARLSKEIITSNDYPVSSGEKVSFYFGENISSLKSFFGIRKKQKEILTKIIKEHDVIIARLPSEYGLISIDIAKKLNKPVLIEVVACVWDSLWNYGNLKAKFYAPYMFFKMKNSINKSKYTMYVTNKFLQKRYPSNGKNISVSDVEIMMYENTIIEKRIDKIKNKDHTVVFGIIGSFKTKYKGIHTAIEVFSLLSSKYENIQLRILGSGNKTEYIGMSEQLGLKEKIYFDGILPNSEVLNWLDNLDIYMQPSFVEGMPRALIEAMSRGCPIIASNVGDIPDLIDNSCLFTPGNIKQISSLIDKNINDIDWYINQAKKNFDESKKYQKMILDKKRNDFFKSLMKEV